MKYCFLCASTFSISGCITSDYSAPLAPPPDKLPSTYYQNFAHAKNDNTSLNVDDEVIVAQDIYLSPMLQNLMAQGVVNHNSVMTGAGLGNKAVSLNGSEGSGYKCRWKDRLDRKAVIAYEWDRSRFSMDVDGVNMSGNGEYGMRVEYKLRLQPEKRPRELCRYKSSWQGMIGSGYHEFFVREEDTVWQGIKHDVKRIKTKVTNVTDRFF